MRDYTTATEGKSLHDVVSGDIETLPNDGFIDYEGFHILRVSEDGDFQVQYDGHVGCVFEFNYNDYNDVTELVKDLNRYCVSELNHYDYQDDKEGLVEWAGRMMTHDKERAEEKPNLYLHIPEDVASA